MVKIAAWSALLGNCVMLYMAGIHAQSLGMTPKILGGSNAPQGQVPFFGAMFFKGNPGYSCGGSLIGPDLVLTAAVCVSLSSQGGPSKSQDTPVPLDAVGFNFGKLDKQPDTPIGVKAIIIHKQFNSTGEMDNNIALVRLAQNVTSESILLSKIYPNVVKTNEQFQVAGMGVTDLKGNMGSNSLQVATVTVADSEDCHLGNTHYKNPDGLQICATANEGQGTCQGDSGGPLYKAGGQGGQSVLVGLTSFGARSDVTLPQCGAKGALMYFTHVSKYITWISKQAGIPVDQLSNGAK